MTTAGYIDYDSATGRFTLPPEHVPALAQETGPFFFGGVYEMLPALAGVLDQVTRSFRQGGGVPQSAYDSHFWDGMERFSMGWFENLLTQQWIPAMRDVQAKLERGRSCWRTSAAGVGGALSRWRRRFPTRATSGTTYLSRQLTGRPRTPKQLESPTGCAFNSSTRRRGCPAVDVVTTFDVVHDAADPLRLLRSIRAALRHDGIYVCLEINCSDRLEQNAGALGAMHHGFSVLYCMTTSLANGGVGLGTVGLHEPKLRELCAEVGFSSVRRVPLENPFNTLYKVRP